MSFTKFKAERVVTPRIGGLVFNIQIPKRLRHAGLDCIVVSARELPHHRRNRLGGLSEPTFDLGISGKLVLPQFGGPRANLSANGLMNYLLGDLKPSSGLLH
jgi:hypothetical protein